MIGVRIANQRKRLGISQGELAKILKISPSAIGMYEQGRREPSIDTIVALARALSVSTDYLLTGKHSTDNAKTRNHSMMILVEETPEGKIQTWPLSEEDILVIKAYLSMRSD